MSPLNRYYASLVGVFFQALVILNGFERFDEFIIYLFFLAACLAWRDYNFGKRYLYADIVRARRRWERRLFFQFGFNLEDEEADQREVRDLQELVGRGRRMRAYLFYFLAFGATLLIFHSKGFAPPAGLMAIGIAGFVLANASHASHLLLALFLSLPLVLQKASRGDLGAAETFFYVFLFFISLMVFRQLVSTDQRRDEPLLRPKLNSDSVWGSLRTAGIFFYFTDDFPLLDPRDTS
jgi:hypothetical protein